MFQGEDTLVFLVSNSFCGSMFYLLLAVLSSSVSAGFAVVCGLWCGTPLVDCAMPIFFPVCV